MKKYFIVLALALCGCGSGVKETAPKGLPPPTEEQANAFTDKLAATWKGDCQFDTNQNMSYQDHLLIDVDRTFVISTDTFLNTNCSGQPVDTAEDKGTFVISGVVSEVEGEVDLTYAEAFDDGDISFLRARVKLSDADNAALTIKAMKVMNNGQVVNIPASQLNQIPAALFHRE